MQFHHKWLLLGLLAGLLIALPVLLLATRQQQDTRSHAASPNEISNEDTSGEDSEIDANNTTDTPTDNSPTINKKVAVIMVRFKDDTDTKVNSEYDPTTLNDLFFGTRADSVKNFHNSASFGRVNLTGDVIGWVNVPQYTRAQACNTINPTITNTIDAAAAQSAAARGLDFNSYNIKFYYYTRLPLIGKVASNYTCSWRAIVRATGGNIAFADGKYYMSSDAKNIDDFAHELGHLRGFYHAEAISCNGKQIDDYSKCKVINYGDIFDTMGVNYDYAPGFSALRKYYSGDIPASNVLTLQPSNKVQRITLLTSSKKESGFQLLKLQRPGISAKDSIYVEYRQKVGVDSRLPDPAVNGALIRVVHADKRKTYLLDTNPQTSTMRDAALSDGRVFQDSKNGIKVTQVSHSGDTLVLDVLYNPSVVLPTLPATTGNPTAKPTKVPSVKPTAGVTSSPTPTETVSGNSNLNVTIVVPGIGPKGNKNPKNNKKKVTVDVYSAGGNKVGSFNKSLTYQSSTGVFSGQIPVTIPASGPYNLYFNSNGYLKTRVDANLTLGGANTIPAVNLAGGDLNGDGVRNLLDWNIMRACLIFPASRDTKVCPDGSIYMQNADMDSSGVVDQDDITLWILQYKPL